MRLGDSGWMDGRMDHGWIMAQFLCVLLAKKSFSSSSTKKTSTFVWGILRNYSVHSDISVHFNFISIKPILLQLAPKFMTNTHDH